MKTVFVDTNVILDVLLQNDVFFQDSLKVFNLSETKDIQAYVSASSLTDVFYIARKRLSIATAHSALNALLAIFNVVGIDGDDLRGALNMPIPDMEDALQLWCAEKIHADVMITRDIKGFPYATMAVLSPSDFLEYHFT